MQRRRGAESAFASLFYASSAFIRYILTFAPPQVDYLQAFI